MHYKAVFDITQQPMPDIRGPLIAGTIVFFVGVIGLVAGSRHRREPLRLIAGLFFTAFGCCLILAPILTNWRFRELVHAYKTGRCAVVEGPVEDFEPMPASGHGLESFRVGETRFRYSDFVDAGGFHRSSTQGGPIRPDLYVRIYYLRNTIARLEVVD